MGNLFGGPLDPAAVGVACLLFAAYIIAPKKPKRTGGKPVRQVPPSHSVTVVVVDRRET